MGKAWTVIGSPECWDVKTLGPEPRTWSDVERLVFKSSDKLNYTLRILSAGLHELRANQRARSVCKSVPPILGAIRLCEDPNPPPAPPRPSPAVNGHARQSLSVRASSDSHFPATIPEDEPVCEPLDDEPEAVEEERAQDDGGTDVASAAPAPAESAPPEQPPSPGKAHDQGATHLMLLQPMATPLYGTELTDPGLAWQIYGALRELHSTLVHGDVNCANIVWDPTGYFFQFVDLELATWRSDAARVVSEAVAFPKVGHVHGSTPVTRVIVHGTLEFCSINQLKGKWPTCADDLISLFWSTVAAFCPRSLWWGGLQLQALEYDERNEIESRLLMTEEANLLAYAQVLYLSSDQDSVVLYRSHDLQQVGDAAAVRFEASVEVSFVPSSAPALQRWKHYVARAFAQKHVLRLTLSAGTEDEEAAMKDMYRELRELLHKMGDFDSDQSWERLRAESPMDAAFLAALQDCEKKNEAPLPYSTYLDQLESLGVDEVVAPPELEDERAGLTAVCFNGVRELRTSQGAVLWGAAEHRRHADSLLVRTPWQFSPGRSYEDCAKALRACCQSANMGFEPVDNPWDCAVTALQDERLREHARQRSKSWRKLSKRSLLLPMAVLGVASFVFVRLNSRPRSR